MNVSNVFIKENNVVTPEQAAEAVAGKATAIAAQASKVTWFGSGGAILGGFSVQEIGVLAGIIIALGGLIVNWYYKHKAHKLKVEWYKQNTPENLKD
jgi:hypothetical protein